MSFLIIILAFIIIFFVWPAAKLAYKVKRANDQAREQFEEMRREAERRTRQNRPGGWHTDHHTPKKKYSSTEGEYVEWEEVKVSTETTTQSSTDHTTRVEQQITDVEWEDIKITKE